MKKYIKLSQWAKNNNYTYRGAFGLFQRGGLTGSKQLLSGAIVVEDEDDQSTKEEYTIIYARVPSNKNKELLKQQVEKITQFCAAKGWVVKEVVKETVLDWSDNRPKLLEIFCKRKATRIVIEHKSKLTQFGFNYIEALYPECEFVALCEEENPE